MSDVLFDEFLAEATFVLTGDQDWAPDWAVEAMLALAAAEDVPLHLFVTNGSRALEGEVRPSLGIHPNFLPGSSHGASDEEVIASCLRLVPDARSVRCHAFHENSRILTKLRDHGLIADSNLLCFLQPRLVPLIRGTGLLTFPVVFEDDIFLRWGQPSLDLTPALRLLLTPGLKVLNFHPALVALNAPSIDFYDAHRARLYGGATERCAPYAGRGVATVLTELIKAVKDAGLHFVPFDSLVDRAYESLTATFPDGLYDWLPERLDHAN